MAYSKLDLTGRTAVVIGGTSGIGFTLAKGLAQAGANVVASGRRTELVSRAAEEIRRIGVKSLDLPCDVSKRESLEGLLDGVVQRFGAVDILVNCAGKTKRTPTLEV